MTAQVKTPNGARLEAISSYIDELREQLIGLSLDIHAHPELNYEEHYCSARLADFLESHGFRVERGVGGVETAFRATAEGGAGEGPTVALLAEYDALPEIGHACGHNLIATATVGAGIAARSLIEQLPGTLQVIGTPAEEGGGGKIRLLEAGVFDGVDIAITCHPAANRSVIPTEVPLDEIWALALVGFRYKYYGRAAHAAVAPEQGINALNAVIHLFNGIDALRQHLRDGVRIHGIITDGGKAANVVPDFAAANFMLRSRDKEYLKEIVEKWTSKKSPPAASTAGGARITFIFLPHVLRLSFPFLSLSLTFLPPLARLASPATQRGCGMRRPVRHPEPAQTSPLAICGPHRIRPAWRTGAVAV